MSETGHPKYMGLLTYQTPLLERNLTREREREREREFHTKRPFNRTQEVGRVGWALGLKVLVLGSTGCAP